VDELDPQYPRRSLYWGCTDRELLRASNETLQKQQARFSIITQQLDRCALASYFPRTLSANQISWKARPKAEQQKKQQQQSASGNSSATGLGASANNVSHDDGELTNSTTKPKEVVHNFLLFAVLLPSHPFSFDLLESLRAIAPMYPEVSVVIGSAYDFTDFCSHYSVRSYPKLLFFRNGLLRHKFKGSFNPWGLAATLSEWTQMLPRAAPDPGMLHKWIVPPTLNGPAAPLSLAARLAQQLSSSLNRSTTGTISTRFWRMLSTRVTEPVAGTSEVLAAHDFHLTVLATLFVISRTVVQLFQR